MYFEKISTGSVDVELLLHPDDQLWSSSQIITLKFPHCNYLFSTAGSVLCYVHFRGINRYEEPVLTAAVQRLVQIFI